MGGDSEKHIIGGRVILHTGTAHHFVFDDCRLKGQAVEIAIRARDKCKLAEAGRAQAAWLVYARIAGQALRWQQNIQHTPTHAPNKFRSCL
ncbi:MAG: hypothetical protein CK529_12915 [Rhodospirillaceae bacterium]|nr:MAG: hypothetical protein CK529_12915 [Rhodospirillaceae bacterium]